MRALRVRLVDQRWIERHIREEPERYRAVFALGGAERWGILFVQLQPFLLSFGEWGRHPVCTTFAVWHAKVMVAFMDHGWYDPLTNHTPPAERQLDSIEMREEGRALFQRCFPALGTVFGWGYPTTDNDEETDDDGA
jgi:hypothetical protein